MFPRQAKCLPSSERLSWSKLLHLRFRRGHHPHLAPPANANTQCPAPSPVRLYWRRLLQRVLRIATHFHGLLSLMSSRCGHSQRQLDDLGSRSWRSTVPHPREALSVVMTWVRGGAGRRDRGQSAAAQGRCRAGTQICVHGTWRLGRLRSLREAQTAFLAGSGQARLRGTSDPSTESCFTQVGSEATQTATCLLGDGKEEQGCAPEGPCPGTPQLIACAEKGEERKTSGQGWSVPYSKSWPPDPLPWT